MATTVYCLAPGCTNNSKVTEGVNPPVFYHRIKDESKWYKFCCLNRQDSFAKTVCERPELALCSAHFDPLFYQDGKTLPGHANPTIPVALEETQKICYICFNPESICTLVPIEEEIISDLASIKLEFVKASNVPIHLCTGCNGEIIQILNYCDRVKGANDFWGKFGSNIGVVKNTITKNKNQEEGEITVESSENNYACKECTFKTSNKDSLFRHIWHHHVKNLDEPNKCGVCNKILANETSNRIHYLNHHYENIQYESSVCVYCGFVAKTAKHLAFHLKFTHDIIGKDFLCEWCTHSFDSQEDLDLHLQQRHKEILYQTNSEIHHTETIIDTVVPVVVTKQEKTIDKNYFDDNSSQMDVDDRNYSDADDLPVKKIKSEPKNKQHNEHESLKPKLITTQPKKKKRKNKPTPAKGPEVVKECPECSVIITGSGQIAIGGLHRHFWVRHGRIPESPNICKGCKKSFNTEHSCRLHFFNHHFQKNFICEDCGKTDMTKMELNHHKKKVCQHSQAKVNRNLIVCRFCNRKYDSIEKMAEHEKEHENDGIVRPFVCNECGKYFTKELNLQAHMQKHRGYKYECSYCDMKFTCASGKTVHEYQHTGYSPFKCSLCDKEFKQLALIRGHILRNHGSYDEEILKNEIIIRKDGPAKRGRRGSKLISGYASNSNNSYYDEGSISSL